MAAWASAGGRCEPPRFRWRPPFLDGRMIFFAEAVPEGVPGPGGAAGGRAPRPVRDRVRGDPVDRGEAGYRDAGDAAPVDPPGRGGRRAAAGDLQRRVRRDPQAACRVRELWRANEILKAASAFFAAGRTGHCHAREVHRRAQRRVRSRAGLPRADRARRADRTEHLLRRQDRAAVGAGGARCELLRAEITGYGRRITRSMARTRSGWS
jgi:hypothetical protein